MKSDVIVFNQYPFVEGDKIRIEEGRRRGDWEVAAVGEHKITLRCPISKREFSWNKFCYMVKIEKDTTWPQDDQ